MQEAKEVYAEYNLYIRALRSARNQYVRDILKRKVITAKNKVGTFAKTQVTKFKESIKDVDVFTSSNVIRVIKENDKYQIRTDKNQNFESDFVVFATGGKTYYKECNGYIISSMLSHRVTSLRPTLSSLKVKLFSKYSINSSFPNISFVSCNTGKQFIFVPLISIVPSTFFNDGKSSM